MRNLEKTHNLHRTGDLEADIDGERAWNGVVIEYKQSSSLRNAHHEQYQEEHRHPVEGQQVADVVQRVFALLLLLAPYAALRRRLRFPPILRLFRSPLHVPLPVLELALPLFQPLLVTLVLLLKLTLLSHT